MSDDYARLISEMSKKTIQDIEDLKNKEKRKKTAISIGKWFAEHTIELIALLIAIAAFVRTL